MKLTAKPLDPEDMQKIIQSKLDWITANSQPQKVILFGSAARESMTEASDVDLIIIYSNREELKQAKEQLFKSRPVNDWPHDILFYTSEDFLKSVAKGGGACWLANKEGKTLFEEGPI